MQPNALQKSGIQLDLGSSNSPFDEETQRRIQAARAAGVPEGKIQLEATQYQAAKEASKPKDEGLAGWLPAIGAVAGSLTPLGLIGGGAVGAGIGAIAKQAILKEKPNVGEIAKETALGAVGGVIGKGVASVGSKFLPKIAKVGQLEEKLAQGTRQIKQPASVFGAGKEKAIETTLNKYKFSGPAQKQYEMLEPTLTKIENEIQTFITANPTLSVPKEQIKKAFLDNMKVSLTRDMTNKQAITEVDSFLTDLLKASGGTGKFTNIPLSKLRVLKKLVNEVYDPVNRKKVMGGVLTPRERVIDAAWDSLDDAVKTVSPEVKALLTDESNLYKAAGSLSSARSNPPTFRFAGTSVPAFATQAGRTGLGKIAKPFEAAYKGGGKVLPPIIGQGTVQTAFNEQTTKLIPEELSNESQQGYNNNNGQQGFQNNLPPPTTNIPQIEEKQYQSGYSPEQLYTAYMNAQKAGNKTAATQLHQWWADETTYQKQNATINKKGVSGTQVTELSDIVGSIKLAGDLDKYLDQSKGLVGPIQGRLGSANPYSSDAQIFNSKMMTAAQIIGKAMEGGVLRQEDMIKYRKILPQISDTYEVAKGKMAAVKSMLDDRLRIKQELYGKYDTSTTLPDILQGESPTSFNSPAGGDNQLSDIPQTTEGQAIALIKKYFPQDQWNNAYAIMMAETSGRNVPSTFNQQGTEDSHGLFQINLDAHPQMAGKVYDPEANIAYAAQLWRESGWYPWLNSARKVGLIG